MHCHELRHMALQSIHSRLPGLQVHEATIRAGAYPSPLNYFNFPKSVCTSVNEVRQVLRS